MVTTYARFRRDLASTLNRLTEDREVIIIRRHGNPEGSRDTALIPADDLAGLMETAYLLRPPANAKRLLRALRRAERGAA